MTDVQNPPVPTTSAPTPGLENANGYQEFAKSSEGGNTSLQRVTEYPVVKSTLSQAYSLAHSTALTTSAYDTLNSLSQTVLSVVAPRLPLQTVDGYANAGLDYVEKKFPAVKDDTSVLVGKVRKPADDAVGLARGYAEGVQSRLSPVTDQFYTRITQGQETLGKLQARLSTAAGSVPRDLASAQETLNSVLHEVESLTTYLTTNAKELPAHAQAAVSPVVDALSKGLTEIREELSKPDVPIATKASNVLKYTQSQVGPVLNSLRDLLVKKKAEVEEAAPTVNGTTTTTD